MNKSIAEKITCHSCSKSFNKEDLKRICCNCFACTGCEIYTCYNCDSRIEIKLPQQMRSGTARLRNQLK